ncbi:MAG TPA: PSD1 and planctomycete cytochrome C domain-containing protein [Candidatus Acidoferrales bacterium]|nr:PSD1 and planctomycete cytochrome C domain-containing protein [Candidatus Acidoferrales bacterium]
MLRKAIGVARSLRGVAVLGIAVYCLAQNRQVSDKQVSSKEVSDKEVLPIVERCLQCHGPTLRMSGLDLRTREGMLKGGTHGPALVPGNAEGSLLYKRVAGLEAPIMPMPPVPALNPEEVGLIRDWINQGAKWAASAPAPTAESTPTSAATPASASTYSGYKEKPITDQDRQWWAFQKPVRYPAPAVGDARWRRNPIDAFIRKAMDDKGLQPAPEADRRTLIRRAYLDLVGLLPPPAEVDAFVQDPSPKAYDNLIERLLASPNYGERWGRNWLDVVRYADSSGFEYDLTVDNAWRYRDYVIKAFNEDKPYDQFVIEHLAGDELDQPTYDSLTATTFYRIGPRVRFREKNYTTYRYDYMDDMIRTTYQGFMGLSVNCARCHDHKFDPITRLDYYRSMAAFWGYVDYDHPLAPKAQVDEYERIKRQLEKEITPLQQEVARIEAPYRARQREQQIQNALKTFPPDIQAAIRTPEAERTPGQKLLVAQVLINPEDANPDMITVDLQASAKARARVKAEDVFGVVNNRYARPLPLSKEDEARRAPLQAKIQAIVDQLPPPLPTADGVRDGDYRLAPDGQGDSHIPGTGRPVYDVKCCFVPEPGQAYQAPPLYFAATGDDLQADEKTFLVQPGFLKVLSNPTPSANGTPPPAAAHPPNRTDYSTSGRRRALAEAIASKDNPLTARVMVNRIWGWHFGRGIVATPGNFGRMGMAPSHPELLDWLATEFVRQGWSVKQIHRLIMTSETYKMASAFYQATDLEKDPTGVYLWRFPVRRLEGEIIRDVMLDASGDLNREAGGPPFFPSIPVSVRADQPRGVWDLTKEGPDTWKRSVYAYVKRGLKYPMFEVFDLPDLNITCERRTVSTVPTQALTMLNNEFTLIRADRFARRVLTEAGTDPASQVKTMYRIAFSREPAPRELESNVAFLKKQMSPRAGSGADSGADQAALTDLAHVVLNLNEFVYLQ